MLRVALTLHVLQVVQTVEIQQADLNLVNLKRFHLIINCNRMGKQVT